MARGKHGRRAEVRRDAAETETTLASYQHRVARLTAENRDLQARLDEQARAAKAVERRLRAERDEGAAPQVQALSLALRAATEERDRAKRHARQLQKHWDQHAPAILLHFENEHGLTHVEAWETVLRLLGARPDVTVVDDAAGVSHTVKDPEVARRIQQSRGERGRSSGKSTTATAAR